MRRKAKKKIVKHGWLESPLFLSLIRLIPSVLLLGGIVIGASNLILRNRERVLGIETYLPQVKEMTFEERVGELKKVTKRVRSEQLESEIKKLLGL